MQPVPNSGPGHLDPYAAFQGPPPRPPRPTAVTLAVIAQILAAVSIVIGAVVGYVYGAEVETAYERELAEQTGGAEVAPGSTGFDFWDFDGVGDLMMVFVLVGFLVVLTALNGAGNRAGRVLTWILQPLVFVFGAFIFTRLMQGYDLGGRVAELDARALAAAAFAAAPPWSIAVGWATAASTIGSLAIILLLAAPSANAFFRKPRPPYGY
ncbi:hypothetical protein [Glycomyces harbinensis]|uniref:Uncharacterized protein n=1 Tax=Glycomyces harbinensis TaxID=58114 RepID=A0A1G6TPI7_9ACTN|nr:hypothetical protein [Glycomyces harbinensis]SDD30396.1 hypothetical protein SAMN05216270_10359 [Glycomyces harbinensis]